MSYWQITKGVAVLLGSVAIVLGCLVGALTSVLEAFQTDSVLLGILAPCWFLGAVLALAGMVWWMEHV